MARVRSEQGASWEWRVARRGGLSARYNLDMLVDSEVDQMIDHVPPGPSGTGGLGLDGRVTLTDIAHSRNLGPLRTASNVITDGRERDETRRR
jgi:hypothetical protein